MMKGNVIAVDRFVGVHQREERNPDFENFVAGASMVANGLPSVQCSITDGEVLRWRIDRSQDDPVVFLIYGGATADLASRFSEPAIANRTAVTDNISGKTCTLKRQARRVRLAGESFRVLRFGPVHAG